MSIRTRSLGLALAATIAVGGLAQAAEPDDASFSPNPQPHSPVIDWVDAMLLAIERHPPAPTATTWRMWVVFSSMYDAWTAYHPSAQATHAGFTLRRPAAEHTDTDRATAVSFAAHNALSHVFPSERALFDSVLGLHGLAPSRSVDPATPAGVGNIAADHVIRSRSVPGANAYDFGDTVSELFPEPYRPVTAPDPSRWSPLHVPTGTLLDVDGVPTWSPDDPSSYTVQEFLTPHWGSVQPFALASGDQFRPAAPPKLGSDAPYVDATGQRSTGDEAFRAQTQEVLRYSSELGDEHKVVAEFWADGPHTWTPPGHWVQLAIGISLRDQHGLDEDVCMYMALAGALLDAGIAAWDAKRAHDYVRPVSAIQHLYGGQRVHAWRGPGRGHGPIDGTDWQPYQATTFVTPPFAEYVSGHSAFSAAASEVLAGYSGTDRMYDGWTRLGRDYDGDGFEDLFGRHVAEPGWLSFEDGPTERIVLRWDTLGEAADEAGISRLYGGIHFQDGDLRGRELGRLVGQQALRHARSLWSGGAPAGIAP